VLLAFAAARARGRIAWLAALLVLASLVAAGAARAGGTQVAVVATASRVWVTTGSEVVELDATSGRVLYRIKTRYPYPLEVGVSDGVVWTSSVANGFVSGAVTRFPFDSSATTQSLVLPHRPLLGLAVGSGTTWALVGPWRSLRLAAIDQSSGRVRLAPVTRELAWVAADNTGGTAGLYGVTRGGRLVRLDPGRNVGWRAGPSGLTAPPAVAGGSVWAASRTSLYRVDAQTGRTRARTGISGSPVQLAAGGGFLWLLGLQRTKGGVQYSLSKYDGHLRLLGRRNVGSSADSVAFGDGVVWIGRARPSVSVVRVDPQSLRLKVVASGLG
jgi:hypothetical protein